MEKIQILADHLDCEVEEIEEINSSSFKYLKAEFLIYSDDEVDEILKDLAEELFEQELKDVPEHLRDYLNKEEYIDDNYNFDLISPEYSEVLIENEEDDYIEMYYIFEV